MITLYLGALLRRTHTALKTPLAKVLVNPLSWLRRLLGAPICRYYGHDYWTTSGELGLLSDLVYKCRRCKKVLGYPSRKERAENDKHNF